MPEIPSTDNELKTRVKLYHLYINESWYLRIDNHGYVARSDWAEGALGCVLRLSSTSSECRMALKIPRLLADTVRENAFVAELLAQEEQVVHRANAHASSPSGIVRLQVAHRNPLRGICTLSNCEGEDAVYQDRGVLFISYADKSMPPRFCNVRKQDAEFSFFPPGVGSALRDAIPLQWDELLIAGRTPGSALDFQRTVFIRVSASPEAATAGALSDSICTRRGGVVWFSGVPSIMYDWADGTLEEAVSRRLTCSGATRGEQQPWSVGERYIVILKVLRGLDTLHRCGIVHGDIRPANIMAMGSLNDPECYSVGDYGSFSMSHSIVEEGRASTGHTPMGPVIGNHRSSIFYSPERKEGVERESADVAIVFRMEHEGQAELFICVGWKRELLNEDNLVTVAVRRRLQSQWKKMAGDPTDSLNGREERLQGGDRIRLREQVFTVIDSREGPRGETYFRCEPVYADVVHDRMAALNRRAVLDNEVLITLARYVELSEWTAATDMFGVGVLSLYLVFMGSGASEGGGDDGISPECPPFARLEELVTYIASAPFYAGVGRLLQYSYDLLCQVDAHMTPAEVAGLRVDDPVGKKTLQEAIEDYSSTLVDFLPAGRELLGCFANNQAHFLMFVHFVVACVHRSGGCGDTNSTGYAFTFCRSRHQKAVKGGPAETAYHHLKRLSTLLRAPAYEGFVCSAEPCVRRTSGDSLPTTVNLQLRNRSLQEEVDNLKAAVEKSQEREHLLARVSERVERLRCLSREARNAGLFKKPKLYRKIVSIVLGEERDENPPV